MRKEAKKFVSNFQLTTPIPIPETRELASLSISLNKMAMEVVQSLEAKGYAVSAIGDHELLICVTDTNASHIDAFVDAFKEVNS